MEENGDHYIHQQHREVSNADPSRIVAHATQIVACAASPNSLFGDAAPGLEPRILRACRQFSGWKPSASDRELQYVP